jgi:hypothetical protein
MERDLLNCISVKNYRQKKPPEALPQREAKNQAEHYEEDLLGGITPGGS